jgi:hypothetical protein
MLSDEALKIIKFVREFIEITGAMEKFTKTR